MITIRLIVLFFDTTSVELMHTVCWDRVGMGRMVGLGLVRGSWGMLKEDGGSGGQDSMSS